ncbi:magnesium-translocating P-type ATPase [Nannocystis bainbridge]|uniref:Magnesium-transporting ATPase, P-type 1 n=1 Tax=Nannocystis bainbridge TaxID=2995303 RepID=A0ABT5DUG1_9BACT|nr:magnesium-translocating P-type ATPase [Nannocystis bainbridge]MDC0716679.1 magnesium-translocating P-type ATPase [Nannocystis bainbridge]
MRSRTDEAPTHAVSTGAGDRHARPLQARRARRAEARVGVEADPMRAMTAALSEAFTQLRSSERGLTDREVRDRLAALGLNEVVPPQRANLVRDVLARFANPLIAILAFASVVSLSLGDLVNASIILVMIALSIALETFQTRRSQAAAERLRGRVAPEATALRDGHFIRVPQRELVPGDVVRLAAGALVPADCRLVTARDLHVQQAALTGEPLPAEKEATAGPAGDVRDPAGMPHAVFLGTSVVSGVATALVVATGARTQFGDIARALARRGPRTEFEVGMFDFGAFILKTVVFLVLFVFVIAAAGHRPVLEALLFALALAVGLTPEFLPMITTVTLGEGALRMAKQRVIVKNLAAIQNLGSIDVLCCDKTGTLTEGRMTLERHVDPFGAADERPLRLASINSFFESGIDYGFDDAVLDRAGIDPLDAAVLRHEHPDLRGWRKLDELPFDFERRRISILAEKDGASLLVTKGAPEGLLAQATSCETGGARRPLDAELRARCEATFRELSTHGYRVLAVAYKEITDVAPLRAGDEAGLTLAGFLAFVDAPLLGAARVLEALAAEGVRVKIVSGDNELVVRHIADRVGIAPGQILLGAEVDRLGDAALGKVAEETRLFARVSPAHKSRIIRALRARGHVVGYLGDGINDAPSLHGADVGISVAGAVDVARDAAEVILLERDLGVLLAGILEGRRAFGNVMKYVLMGTSSNFGNMVSMAGAFVVLPFLPMLPTQILLNNFLYDLAQITIPTDNVDPGFLKKPRRWDIGLIRRFMVVLGPVSSLYDILTFYALLHLFHASPALFHTGWFVESLVTQTLVLFVIRTAARPWDSRPSRPLVLTALAVVITALVLPWTPLATPLGFVALPPGFFLFLVVVSVTYLAFVEGVKRRLFARFLE